MQKLFAVVVILLGVCAARADDWTEFRGPTGEGHAKGSLPTEWGPDKNVAWKQDVPGEGWSSPVVSEGRIYLTSAVPVEKNEMKEVSLRTLCLDAKTGKVLWDVEAIHPDGTKARHHSKNSNASPTPVLDGKHIYVHFGHMGTACLDLDGKVLWRQTDLGYQPVHGNGGSPILVDDLLVFSIDGGDKQCVVALERATGKVKWQTDRKSKAERTFSFSTPLLIDVNGRKQIVSPASDVVTAYDPKTGEEIWRLRYDGYSVIPRPVYGHGLLFLSTGYNTPVLMAIRPDGKGDVTETHVAWTMPKNAPHTPSPLLIGNELYMVSDGGTASCLDAKTGDVHWSERLGGGFSSSPLEGDGKVYFQNEAGVGFVVKAGTKYELLAKNDLKERTLASYAAADGALFIRTAKRLYRIEKR
ncbi:MAG TPA: PQQ-binding-like beta-propeller repeat protein [Gemmataceae bacterium]|nr:PQQ-binding-like beta-propeller repeat protein [Gemmataceae bacterium]